MHASDNLNDLKRTIFIVTMRPADLPDFKFPPVAETVLSAQFTPISAIHTAHFGLYWKEIQKSFPNTEEQGELSPILEVEDVRPPQIGIELQALQAPPSPRFWFTAEDGTEMIQLQKDRFIKNWRKFDGQTPYPRYEVVKDGFDRDFTVFKQFLETQKLGPVQVNQWEISYVNHIVAGQGWANYSDVERVFTLWKQPTSKFPGAAQDLMFQARFPIKNARGTFLGRLYAFVQCAINRTDNTPMFIFNLTARGPSEIDTDFFDIGREWIVKSFKELTTPHMHEIWGIKE